MLQISDHLQQFCILPVLWAPNMDAVLQLEPYKGWMEGDNHLSLPSGHLSFDAAQHVVGLMGIKCMLLAHLQLSFHQDPHVLLLRTAFYELFLQFAHIWDCLECNTLHLALLNSFFRSLGCMSSKSMDLSIFRIMRWSWTCSALPLRRFHSSTSHLEVEEHKKKYNGMFLK